MRGMSAVSDLEASGADDYYRLLGIDRGASTQEARRAYVKLARELHPDRCTDSNSHQRMHDIVSTTGASM